MDFLAGYKTHILVAGMVASVLFKFLGGEVELGTAVQDILGFLAVSTFKIGVDRGLKK
jgi:hypothetical protein